MTEVMKEQDVFFKNRVEDLKNMAFQRDIVTFTGFLGLHELHMIKNLEKDFPGIATETFGGYQYAERQMAAFIPDALCYGWEYPICCMKVTKDREKFQEALSHRDYLGAVINLGVDRSMVGDILIRDSDAWFFCVDSMAAFFAQELVKIRHTAVHTQALPQSEPVPEPSRKPVRGTVSSMRLDAVIAVAFGGSRTKLMPLIQGGKVYVNGSLATSNGYTLKEGDVVSVRGKGKFSFQEVLSQTKKGRYAILLELYQ